MLLLYTSIILFIACILSAIAIYIMVNKVEYGVYILTNPIYTLLVCILAPYIIFMYMKQR